MQTNITMHTERERLKRKVSELFSNVQEFADLFGLQRASMYTKYYYKDTPFKLPEKKLILEKINEYTLENYGKEYTEKEVFGTTGNIDIKVKGNRNNTSAGDINFASLEIEALRDENFRLKKSIEEKNHTIDLQGQLIASLKAQLKNTKPPE